MFDEIYILFNFIIKFYGAFFFSEFELKYECKGFNSRRNSENKLLSPFATRVLAGYIY